MISLSSVLPWQLFLITESSPYLIIQYPILSLNAEISPSPTSGLSRSPWLIFILSPQEPSVSQVHFIRESANGCLGKNIFQVNAYKGSRRAALRDWIYLLTFLIVCLFPYLIPFTGCIDQLLQFLLLVFFFFHSWLLLSYILFLLNFSMLRRSKLPKEDPRGKVLMQLWST